jgi:hypothetical protein
MIISKFWFHSHFDVDSIPWDGFQDLQLIAFNVQTEIIDSSSIESRQDGEQRETLNLNVIDVVSIWSFILMRFLIRRDAAHVERLFEYHRPLLYRRKR